MNDDIRASNDNSHFKNLILPQSLVIILYSSQWICATLSQEAKDKSDEKMDLADAVGADGSCYCG
ncbi:MAG: hypothetical protein V7K89_30330 [Nostoc sp.]|uniref:hypothetical protein n=1 Tax=Nostoc sp. TaxID=1180 RepID=UPI002FF7BFE0